MKDKKYDINDLYLGMITDGKIYSLCIFKLEDTLLEMANIDEKKFYRINMKTANIIQKYHEINLPIFKSHKEKISFYDIYDKATYISKEFYEHFYIDSNIISFSKIFNTSDIQLERDEIIDILKDYNFEYNIITHDMPKIKSRYKLIY